MNTGAGLIRGDALHIPLADESVDLIVTSPPYFALRSYQDDGEHYDGQIGSEPTPDEFLRALWAVMDECWRVLKPTGSAWVNLGDKYAGSQPHNDWPKDCRTPNSPQQSAAKDAASRAAAGVAFDVPTKSLMGLPWRFALGLTCPADYRFDVGPWHQWTLRAEVVWSKPNGLPESVTDRVRRSHEQWFHLTKQGRYFAAVDEVRQPHGLGTMSRGGGRNGLRVRLASNPSGTIERGRDDWEGGVNPLGALPGSVWTIPSEPLQVPDDIGVDHFAAFPQEWPRRIILGWSPSGICIKCREGRRPVVEKAYVKRDNGKPVRVATYTDNNLGGSSPLMRDGTGSTEATITGYACACDVTLAPTTPAVVLDPFVGTGTVPLVARTLGRYGVGLDLSRDYLRLATWRIWRSGHGRKAMARTDRERQGGLW